MSKLLKISLGCGNIPAIEGNIANLDITPFINTEPSAETQAPIVITKHDPDMPMVAIAEILDNKNVVTDHELFNDYDVRGQLKTNVQDIQIARKEIETKVTMMRSDVDMLIIDFMASQTLASQATTEFEVFSVEVIKNLNDIEAKNAQMLKFHRETINKVDALNANLVDIGQQLNRIDNTLSDNVQIHKKTIRIGRS
ncbi:hypothetical protein HK096_008637 [Nowakowskiella sp. JEL0078]|nr:hypothetical protein HK096_008637 [Nowakowskiella sp. JEL0078]